MKSYALNLIATSTFAVCSVGFVGFVQMTEAIPIAN